MPRAELPILWSACADDDLFRIWSYLAREASTGIADKVTRAIERKCQNLAAWPYAGRDRTDLLPGMRSLIAGSYIVFYRVEACTVQVVRVLHQRRDIDAVFVASQTRNDAHSDG